MSQVNTIAHDINEKLRTADVEIQNDYTFEFLLLSQPVLQALNEAGFHKPSPIQLKAIPLGKCGLDLILKSKSGTGKTLVYTIVTLEMVKTSIDHTQALILAPTREIADQICTVITTIGKHIPDLRVGLFIGGLSYKEDIKRVKKCHIAVGAPGRIRHLIEAKHLNVNSVKLFVLDEADRLMDENFQNDINYCYQSLPEQKQFLAISATIPVELKTFLERYMNSPTSISLEMNSPMLLGLKQFVSVLPEKSNIVQQTNAKTDEVCRLLSKVSFTQCIIFCNYQQRAESVSNIINQRGWKSLYISGSQSQDTRLRVINKLKNLECNILLTTNLTARGIDVSNVDLVINYDIPFETATYLHRVGRTGRFGSVGVCISLAACEKDLLDLQHILGDIGGVKLSIAKLPNLLEHNVWKDDLNTFEQIHGVVDPQRKMMNWNFLEATDEPLKVGKKKKERKSSTNNVVVEKGNVNRVSTDDLVKNLAKGLKIEPIVVKEAPQEPKEMEPVIERCTKKETQNEDLVGPRKAAVSDSFKGISTNDLLMQLAQGVKICPTTVNDDNDSSTVSNEVAVSDNYRGIGKFEPQLDGGKLSDPIRAAVSNPYTDIAIDVKDIDQNDLSTPRRIVKDAEISANDVLIKLEQDTKIAPTIQNVDAMSEELINPADLYPWVPVEEPVLSKKGTGLNLLESSDDDEMEMDISTEILNKKVTLTKNIALYHVGKSIQSNNWDPSIIEDSIQPIRDYLRICEEIEGGQRTKLEAATKDVSNDVLLGNISHYSNKLDTDDSESINICKLAYEHIIGGKKDWRNFVSDSKKKKKDTPPLHVEAETDLVNATYHYNDYQDDILASYEDMYHHHFDYYENALAENALTFESVSDFRAWFQQWQMQVRSVTSYVQQNIYLQEMNNYQYYYQ